VRVLLVEDDPDGREAITMMLEEFGAQVHAVSTAEEAYSCIQSERPDVLVSDIGLPHENGYSLVRRMRALDADDGGQTPAAALTAYATAEDTRQALDAGFQAHLSKPVEPRKLALLVEQLARDPRRVPSGAAGQTKH
jgi:CheY-like chemotaxis protein